MQIVIHRGADEIGGTVIELSTENTNILLDVGLPLSQESREVDIQSLCADAVFISHPHQDHFGLIYGLDRTIPVYIGELGKHCIDATQIFLKKERPVNTFCFISNRKKVTVGDFTITPYLVDHSAVDSYGFLIEAEGKRLFYSGDFRAHGRKSILYDRFISNPPHDIDLLFMEGTMLNRDNSSFPDESAVEEKIVEVIRDQKNISFLLSSSQNIDRIVSAYRACLKTGKTLVVDFYSAWILEKVKIVSQHVPNLDWKQVRFYAEYHHDEIVKNDPDYFGDFRKRAYFSRIKKEELENNPAGFLFLSKMSKFRIIDIYKSIATPVNLIYSQWLGYLDYPNKRYYGAEEIAAYRNDPEVNFVYAHTSGHATLEHLQKFAEAMDAKSLIPVHTEYANEYTKHFRNVISVADNEIYTL